MSTASNTSKTAKIIKGDTTYQRIARCQCAAKYRVGKNHDFFEKIEKIDLIDLIDDLIDKHI